MRQRGLEPQTHLPRAFKPSSTGSSSELGALTALLSKLEDKHYFTVDGGSEMDGAVAHFLLGHLSEHGESGWVGLVGLGVAADY